MGSKLPSAVTVITLLAEVHVLPEPCEVNPPITTCSSLTNWIASGGASIVIVGKFVGSYPLPPLATVSVTTPPSNIDVVIIPPVPPWALPMVTPGAVLYPVPASVIQC